MTKNKKISMAVFGAHGRMGQAILEVLSKSESSILSVGVDKENMKDLEKKKLDVVIDFSSPGGTLEICGWCEKNKVPLVVGTTGLDRAQLKVLESAGKKIPLFISPNMSPGVFGFAEALVSFLSVMKEGEVFIEDIHHKNKKDAPSGTAKFLYETLKGAAGKAVKISDPTSVRAGDVFGIHRVSFFTKGEWVLFEHHAAGREVFAQGAVTAAQWLVGQTKGYYEMKDMLKK